jgi:hypothetical protein
MVSITVGNDERGTFPFTGMQKTDWQLFNVSWFSQENVEIGPPSFELALGRSINGIDS